MSSSCILCLRCGLRDFSARMVPLVALWIHELPLYKRTSFLGPCWVLEASLQLPVSCSDFPFPFLHGIVASTSTSNFLLACWMISLSSSSSGSIKVDASQLSSIIKFWLFVRPFLFFLLSERLSQFWSLLQATHYLVWWSLEHLSVLPDHRYTFGGFSSNKVNFVSPFQESNKFLFASTFQ